MRYAWINNQASVQFYLKNFVKPQLFIGNLKCDVVIVCSNSMRIMCTMSHVTILCLIQLKFQLNSEWRNREVEKKTTEHRKVCERLRVVKLKWSKIYVSQDNAMLVYIHTSVYQVECGFGFSNNRQFFSPRSR